MYFLTWQKSFKYNINFRFFPERFMNKLPVYCLFTSKYFTVYFVQIRTFSTIYTVRQRWNQEINTAESLPSTAQNPATFVAVPVQWLSFHSIFWNLYHVGMLSTNIFKCSITTWKHIHKIKINSLNNEPWSPSGCQTGLRREPLIPLSPRNTLRRAIRGDR